MNPVPQTPTEIVNAFASACYNIMLWANPDFWLICCGLLFIKGLVSLAPWMLAPEHNTFQLLAHAMRRMVVYGFIALLFSSFMFYFFYDLTFEGHVDNHRLLFWHWLANSFHTYQWYLLGSWASGLFLRFYYFRFFHPWISSTYRSLRNRQTSESESDIRTERAKYNAKDYSPEKYYDPTGKQIFIGLDSDEKPVYVPASTWLETNMMITGPTRYGKGVVMGCLMDQAIRRGDQLIYIDPKNDRFAPKIMLQTCAAQNRAFYYVSLSDNAIGYWSPFEGGNRRDAYSRLISIFGMTENSGDADFYKAMEKKVFNRLIKIDDPFDIESIYKKVKFHNENCQNKEDRLLKIEAQLENWRQVKSLNPPKGFTGFSLERAMMENAVVYFQGSLNDEVVKTATKAFILEVIQEAARLDRQRKHHLTFVIDEVRFLVSKVLADALATIVGFRVNIVTACQSINDLKTPDDINLDGEATYRSISTNSQLKLVYGGADADTAEWCALLSGKIVKEVTSMERVEVHTAGAEAWERGRTVKPMQEALIHENVVLTLPPRVCVVFRPSELATVTFTAPVKVKDTQSLDVWLQKQHQQESSDIQAANLERETARLQKVQQLQVPSPKAAPVTPVPSSSTQAVEAAPECEFAPQSPTAAASPAPAPEPSPPVDDIKVLADDLFGDEPLITPADLSPSSVSEEPAEAPPLEAKKADHPKYNLFDLAQKEELSMDELRYMFNNAKRKQKLRELLEPEIFAALEKRFHLLKHQNITEETP